MIYLFIFFIVILLTWIGEKFYKKKKRGGIFFFIVAIMFLSIFAGIRSLSVGTDIKVYVVPIFNNAMYYNNYFEFVEFRDLTEPLYLLLNFVVSRFTNDVHWILFFVQLIISICVYRGLYKHKEQFPMWLGIAVYCFLFYNRGFNLIRQSIAIFIIFGFYDLLEKEKYFKFFIVILIAYLFHTSSLMAIPMILLHKYKNNKKILLGVFLFFIIIFINYDNVLEFLIHRGILTSKYAMYYSSGNIDINLLDELLRIFLLGFVLLKSASFMKSDKRQKNFYKSMIIIEFLLTQLGMFMVFASRCSYYYLIYYIIILPMLIKDIEKDKVQMIMLLLIGLFIYWTYTFIGLNIAETYPYKIGI